MGYFYDVIRGGDAQVFDPAIEASCPYAKVLIPRRHQLETMMKRAFAEHGTDSTFSANIVVILCGALAGHRACSYHYGRALATALVEAVGGNSGSEYDEFRPLRSAADGLIWTHTGEYPQVMVSWLVRDDQNAWTHD